MISYKKVRRGVMGRKCRVHLRDVHVIKTMGKKDNLPMRMKFSDEGLRRRIKCIIIAIIFCYYCTYLCMRVLCLFSTIFAPTYGKILLLFSYIKMFE